MKKPTAEALKEARENLIQAREKRNALSDSVKAISGRLTDPSWDESKDGPALEAESRSLQAATVLLDRLTDQVSLLADDLEREQRSVGGNAISDTPGVSVNVITTPTKDTDLPGKFRLNRALRAQLKMDDPDQPGKQKFDGVELEMHQEGLREARAAGVDDVSGEGSIMVPAMCAFGERSARSATSMTARERRDLIVGTASAGGHLVQTNLGELIPFLDPNTPLRQLGARMLTDLVGNLDLPRRLTRAGSAGAVAEQAALTESSPTFNKLSLAPKRQGTYIEMSLQMIRQSSVPMENMSREDLQQALTELQELYAINGSGSSSQPTGILATSGIGSVVGGTNGLIPTWAHVVALETALGNANALKGKLGYLTTPGVVGLFKGTKRDVAGNNFIWEGRADRDGQMNGYNAVMSTITPSTLTKGTANAICHAILFGNFQELIMAYWGGVEIVVDPYSLATTGNVRVTANTFFDVGVRHAASFAAMVDALIA